MVRDDMTNLLAHHGVKGMHWGVRKKTQVKPSSDAKKAGELRKKPLSALTNKQLKVLNERSNLEQNFKRMNPNKVASGRKVATEILATAGIAVAAYNLAQSPIAKAAVGTGKKYMEKRMLTKVATILSTSGPA